MCRRLKEQEKTVKGGEKREAMIDTVTDIETDIERFVSYMHTFNILIFCFVMNIRSLFEDMTNSTDTRME